MSRSYRSLKSVPVATDRSLKRAYNRRLRRTTKINPYTDLDYIDINSRYSYYKRMNESWDIVDFHIDFSGVRDKSSKEYRKDWKKIASK